MSSKNHFVFFSRSLPFHGIGGMEIVVWGLLKEISNSNSAKVTVITTAIKGKPEQFTEDNVSVVAILGVKSRRYTPKWWKLSARYFEEHLMSEATCVISVAMGACGLLFQRERFKDVPILWQAHGTVVGEVISKVRTKHPVQLLKCLRQIKYFIREYRAFRQVDKIVAVGKIVERALTSNPYNKFVDREKVMLIENGVDTKQFHPSANIRKEYRNKYDISQDTFLVVSASRMILQKGIAQGIFGFQKFLLEVPSAHLLIVGDGKERDSLHALAVSCDIEDSVTFVGSKHYSEMPKYFQMGDVFLFPTLREEGAPLNILEALATGLPVVASQFLFESEHISPYIYFVDPRNAQGVATGLRKAYQRRDDESVQLANYYSITNVSRRYVELFGTLKRDRFK